MSLLVVGSMAYDSVETPSAKIENALGGSATFFSAAASYFAPVNLVAVVGEDFSFKDIEFLKNKNVDLTGLTTEPGKTFRWSGRYLANMNDRETLETQLNVFEHFNPVLPEKFKDSEYVFLANINPDLQYNVIQQVKNPKFVAMDTMNFWITGFLPDLKKTLSVVDALVINDSEVRLLSGQDNLFKGAQIIQDMGPKILIIKKGEHGSMLIHRDSYFSCPAIPVENLFDPTGAGDTFAGGFMGYLAMTNAINNDNLRRAILMGTIMASFSVEDFSVNRLKDLSKTEIRQRIKALIDLIHVKEDNNWITK
ncbi:sugar kinase [candidate division KSB1 bacterium]|nr:sugar kinase [candidate division KSB1 bacterium]